MEADPHPVLQMKPKGEHHRSPTLSKVSESVYTMYNSISFLVFNILNFYCISGCGRALHFLFLGSTHLPWSLFCYLLVLSQLTDM